MSKKIIAISNIENIEHNIGGEMFVRTELPIKISVSGHLTYIITEDADNKDGLKIILDGKSLSIKPSSSNAIILNPVE